MTKQRSIQTFLKRRISEENPRIQVVIGPRQVGKTTAIKGALEGTSSLYFTADFPTPLPAEQITLWWQEAHLKKVEVLAIDEIQKIPGWSEVVKKLWDEKTSSLKLIVSGSAALHIEKDLKETLAGRFELIRATHWNFLEANHIFQRSLSEFIEYGCYPGADQYLNDIDRWSSYIRDSIIEPSIGRDIMQLHPVQNPSLFRQVFQMATQFPAQIISFNKLQGQLNDRGAIATIKHYLELMESGFLISLIYKFSTNLIQIKTSSPKIIVNDNALIKSMSQAVHEKIKNPKLGHYFENAVGAHLKAAGWQVYYWKDRNDEVDFICIGKRGERYAIEVKSGPTSLVELKGLNLFCKKHTDFEPCLVSLVNQKLKGIRSISAEEILSLPNR